VTPEISEHGPILQFNIYQRVPMVVNIALKVESILLHYPTRVR